MVSFPTFPSFSSTGASSVLGVLDSDAIALPPSYSTPQHIGCFQDSEQLPKYKVFVADEAMLHTVFSAIVFQAVCFVFLWCHRGDPSSYSASNDTGISASAERWRASRSWSSSLIFRYFVDGEGDLDARRSSPRL